VEDEELIALMDADVREAKERIAKLEAVIRPLWDEYRQGQMADNHPSHREMWEAIEKLLIETEAKHGR
jgi:plasmid stabilization system protein ParE